MTKTQVKENKVSDEDWQDKLEPYLAQFLFGCAFSLGSVVTGKMVNSISNKRVQKQIKNSSNVIEFKEAANA